MRSDMIKLLVPSMPTADELLPYLRRIDAVKVYVNNGPLVQELQARLEQITGANVAIVSNGTVALELALKALELGDDDNVEGVYASLIAVPALTFAASGLSILQNRHTPVLCDVDARTWQLTADAVKAAVKPIYTRHRNLQCVMPVATFGSPIDVAQWEGHPVPVIIDAAGAFPYQEVSKDSNVATCFSLHATKFIGCGEGGFVASANKELIERIRNMASFGENGTNAKMSEYHAAAALASLDRIREKQKTMEHVKRCYGVGLSDWIERRYSSTILNVLLPIPASTVIPRMADAGIETKQWYRPYLDERTEFSVHRGAFPVTDHLREHLLGLPFHNFLSEEDVSYVCNTLKNILLES